MNVLKKGYYLLRYLGPAFVARRLAIEASRRLGSLRRRFAPKEWDQIALDSCVLPGTPGDAEGYARFKREQSIPFLFPLGLPPAVPSPIRQTQVDRQPSLAERLRLLEQDRCVYFFRSPSPEVIDWHRNPFDGTSADPDAVWCDIPDFLPTQGDPRMLWEPSRAAWAIDLARAGPHGITIDAGAVYWRWVDSWMSACRPFRGFQWKCGQESSVRFVAIAIGFWSLANDSATTPNRWFQFARLAWATGYRIHHHIHYAISQKNNHALSEACGLLLISHLFPEFREAARWNALGRSIFKKELLRQTYPDGSYLQHSMNYHRVMLHVSILAMRLAELAGNPFTRDVYDRIARCGEFLFQMMDSQTGGVPNYGHNDGACVLPLNECDFTDYRPAVQASYFLTHRERRLPNGSWDEDLLWLFGSEALSRPTAKPQLASSSAFETGGYYTLRGLQSWCMVRCHTYKDRPGQDDPLHLDLWWRGLNILQDCGTYRYYSPESDELGMYFRSTHAHNTIAIDDVSPVEWLSRFLFFPWPHCKKLRFIESDENGAAMSFEGERYDPARYPRRVFHRRTIVGIANDVWMVIDDLRSGNMHSAVLRWHLLDAPYELDVSQSSMVLKTAVGPVTLCVIGEPTKAATLEVLRGRESNGSVQGFAAPYYGERSPIPTLEASFQCRLPQRIVTFIGCGVSVSGKLLNEAETSERWEVRIGNHVRTLQLRPLSCGVGGTFWGWDSPNEASLDATTPFQLDTAVNE